MPRDLDDRQKNNALRETLKFANDPTGATRPLRMAVAHIDECLEKDAYQPLGKKAVKAAHNAVKNIQTTGGFQVGSLKELFQKLGFTPDDYDRFITIADQPKPASPSPAQ